MSLFGNIGEFIEEKESWTQYTERLNQFFRANDIINEEKKLRFSYLPLVHQHTNFGKFTCPNEASRGVIFENGRSYEVFLYSKTFSYNSGRSISIEDHLFAVDCLAVVYANDEILRVYYKCLSGPNYTSGQGHGQL